MNEKTLDLRWKVKERDTVHFSTPTIYGETGIKGKEKYTALQFRTVETLPTGQIIDTDWVDVPTVGFEW